MKKSVMNTLCEITLIMTILIPFVIRAQIPKLINYQGRLTDAAGLPLTGVHTIHFGIFDVETGGMPLWVESHESVTVTNGLFNVLLGDINKNLGNLDFDKPYYLGVMIDSNSEELTPRKQIVSVGYAMRAENADNAEIASSVINDAISSESVKDGALTGADILDQSLTAVDIADGSGSGLNADLLDGKDVSDIKVLGAWESASLDREYQAPYDGFVVARISAKSNGWGALDAMIRTGVAPAKLVSSTSVYKWKVQFDYYFGEFVHQVSVETGSLMIPVRKGDRWMVIHKNPSGSSAVVWWIPFSS